MGRGGRGGGGGDDDDDEKEDDEEEDDDDDDDDDDVCCGNYVTNMCSGSPTFDSGKFHNHCIQCKKFGTCIGDYRERHCDVCGAHFFAGSMGGFSCQGCGTKSGRLRRPGTAQQDMSLPGPEMMDGQLAGLDDIIQMEERHRAQVIYFSITCSLCTNLITIRVWILPKSYHISSCTLTTCLSREVAAR